MLQYETFMQYIHIWECEQHYKNQFFDIMQLFNADAKVFSKKLKKKILTLKAWKKRPQKLLIIGPDFFFMYWPGCPNDPETEIPYHQKPLNAGLGI